MKREILCSIDIKWVIKLDWGSMLIARHLKLSPVDEIELFKVIQIFDI